jgi:RNA polymerase sigma-70 factor (ECF subfamily)
LVQETFLIGSRKADRWVAGSSFMAWAGTILRYEAMHHLRALRSRPVTLEEDLLELLHGNEPPDDDDDDLLHQIQTLKRCIQKLSPRARQMVMLRYDAGMLPEAIAKSLRWTANSVRVTLTRAKDSLRDCVARKEGGRNKK